jgi:hypothetical protein
MEPIFCWVSTTLLLTTISTSYSARVCNQPATGTLLVILAFM